MKNLVVGLAAVLTLSAGNASAQKRTVRHTVAKSAPYSTLAGNYVSADYALRSKGYDWVSVAVTPAENGRLKFAVRSRADHKTPTCTLDAVATKISTNLYRSEIDGKGILYQFRNGQLTVSPENGSDSGLLNFYCSGGASVAGTYKKISGALDSRQIDKTLFSKTLSLQSVGFNVSSVAKGAENLMKISTFGLPNEFNESINIGSSKITGAEVEDLNSDGSPELVVFTKTAGAVPKMNVYAYSVNNKKSLSAVYFQPVTNNSKIAG